MKAIFVTDIHGVRWKYQRLVELAIAQKVDVVLDAGDILPHPRQEDSESFLKDCFEGICRRLNRAGIRFFFIPGNDDSSEFDLWLSGLTADYPLVHNIAGQRISLGRYDFIGMNYVLNHPFSFKNRCRRDDADDLIVDKEDDPVERVKETQYRDWLLGMKSRPTIREELMALPRPRLLTKPIYLIHMPPWHLGLAEVRRSISGWADLGSKSVYDFIKKRQPWMTLHGHIHDSPELTGIWQAQLGKTLCIQPGQKGLGSPDGEKLVYVSIDLETRAVERFEELPPI